MSKGKDTAPTEPVQADLTASVAGFGPNSAILALSELAQAVKTMTAKSSDPERTTMLTTLAPSIIFFLQRQQAHDHPMH